MDRAPRARVGLCLRAIGARRSDILTQSLAEDVLASLIGGLTDVLVGMIGSQCARTVGQESGGRTYKNPQRAA